MWGGNIADIKQLAFKLTNKHFSLIVKIKFDIVVYITMLK